MSRKKSTKQKGKVDQLSFDFDPREKEHKLQKKVKGTLTLEDVGEMVDYYEYYGEYSSVEFGQIDIVKLGKECLFLIELLQQIQETEDIAEAKKIAEEGIKHSTKF